MDNRIPAGLSPERARICEVATGELGTAEVPRHSNRGPIEKYMPEWQLHSLRERDHQHALAKGPAWCAYFATWVWTEATKRSPVGRVGSTHVLMGMAKGHGLWRPKTAPEGPSPGDAFVIIHGPRSGHTGLILRVSECGRHWLTVEGNHGDAVRLGRRSAGEDGMRGWIDVIGDHGGGGWERGLGDVEIGDTGDLGDR